MKLRSIVYLACAYILVGNAIAQEKKEREIQVTGNPPLEFLADTGGNQNGVVEESEADSLNARVSSQKGDVKEFYLLTFDPDTGFRIKPPVPPDISKVFPIFSSLPDFLAHYKGASVTGQVGILMWVLDAEGNLKLNAYSGWGRFAEPDAKLKKEQQALKGWQQETSPEFDYGKMMEERRAKQPK